MDNQTSRQASEKSKIFSRRLMTVIAVSICGIVFLMFNFSHMHFSLHVGQDKKFRLNCTANCTELHKNTLQYVTTEWVIENPGLGNQIFIFAALVFAAQLTNRQLTITYDNFKKIKRYFNLNVTTMNHSCPCFVFHEHSISYDKRIEKEIKSKNAAESQTILLNGYFQSWKYIQPVDHLIRNHMTLKSDIKAFARDFLRNIIPTGWTEGRFARVGVHNRRGDFLHPGAQRDGFTTAPESYFQKAMKYFVERNEKLQFVVISQDGNWSRQHITYDSNSSNVNVVYSFKFSPGEDMAILSLCDHVIVSTGTFGWISAWLANGTTIYYSNYPRNGSDLRKRFNLSEYHFPNWIPME